MPGAVVDDLLRGHRADSRERIELLGRCGGQMHGTGGGTRRRSPGCRTRVAACRNDDLLAVCEGRGEIDQREVGSAGGAPGARDRVGDPGALSQPEKPWPANCADDVHDQESHSGRMAGRHGKMQR